MQATDPRAGAGFRRGRRPDCQLRQIALASVSQVRAARAGDGFERQHFARCGWRRRRQTVAGPWERKMNTVYYIAPTVAMTAYAMLMGVVLMG